MNGKTITDDKIREILASGEYRSQIAIEPGFDEFSSSGYLGLVTKGREEFGWFALELFAPANATAEELFKEGMRMLDEIRKDPEAFVRMVEHQDSLIP